MIVETLLLDILIILLPNFILHVFFEKNRIGESPYFIGILHGISLALCMIFSFKSYGLYWDLRYVPLVLSALQGGPLAGLIVFIAYLVTRTYLGGNALLFGYFSGILAFIGPLLFSRNFWKYSQRKRLTLSVLVGVWPAIVMLIILLSYLISHHLDFEKNIKLLENVLIFGVVQIAAIWFASMLNEIYVERRNMKKEIQRAEKLNTLGELAASIAHEIRNPLTVVKGFLQLMQQQEKDENFQYLSLVLSELGRAESIINDYLNFSKPQFEKIEYVHLSEVISNVTNLLLPTAAKNSVELVCDLEEGIYLKTDKDQIKQVLVNLIKNAIEANSEGGKVFIALKENTGRKIITISDTGKGMDPEQLSRIGTLFYTTKDKGTGLGTSVTLRIIEKMNGKISYKSELGKGTEVEIILP